MMAIVIKFKQLKTYQFPLERSNSIRYKSILIVFLAVVLNLVHKCSKNNVPLLFLILPNFNC